MMEFHNECCFVVGAACCSRGFVKTETGTGACMRKGPKPITSKRILISKGHSTDFLQFLLIIFLGTWRRENHCTFSINVGEPKKMSQRERTEPRLLGLELTMIAKIFQHLRKVTCALKMTHSLKYQRSENAKGHCKEARSEFTDEG